MKAKAGSAMQNAWNTIQLCDRDKTLTPSTKRNSVQITNLTGLLPLKVMAALFTFPCFGHSLTPEPQQETQGPRGLVSVWLSCRLSSWLFWWKLPKPNLQVVQLQWLPAAFLEEGKRVPRPWPLLLTEPQSFCWQNKLHESINLLYCVWTPWWLNDTSLLKSFSSH